LLTPLGGTPQVPQLQEATGRAHQLVLSRALAGATLLRLSKYNTPTARLLYARITNAWGLKSGERDLTTVKISDEEKNLFDSLNLPQAVVQCSWVATYRHDETGQEVVVRTTSKPPKKRAFHIKGGERRLTCISAFKLSNPLQGDTPKMATKTRTRKAKPAVDELDELETLELEDLEEPEAEVEDDDVEETPAPRKRRSRKAKAEPVVEEDDDEEEAPAPKKRTRTRKTAEAEAPAKAAKKNGKATTAQPSQLTRELPKGKLGATEIAEMAGVEGRDVRIFLRKNADTYPKDEELGRYAFTKKEATAIAKAIKAKSA
jgi:outer membrane biosynthesis protein TonB